MAKKGVHVIKGEPVERLSSEGPLDQNLGVSIDHNDSNTIFLESVSDIGDVFERCPAIGVVDCNRGPAGKSMEQSLEGIADSAGDLYLDSEGGDLKAYSEGARTDRYCITDGDWMDNPAELAWQTPLLAQLQARFNAITHYLSDPAVANFAGRMTDEERREVAARAIALSKQLREEGWTHVQAKREGGVDQYRRSATDTKKRFMTYVVTRDDAIKSGGLSEQEVSQFFEEVQ